MTTQQPLARSRAGQISRALRENEIQVNDTTKTALKASVSRRYKDKDRSWKSSQSFGSNEVPLLLIRSSDLLRRESMGSSDP